MTLKAPIHAKIGCTCRISRMSGVSGQSRQSRKGVTWKGSADSRTDPVSKSRLQRTIVLGKRDGKRVLNRDCAPLITTP
jgi:hypothetical protein